MRPIHRVTCQEASHYHICSPTEPVKCGLLKCDLSLVWTRHGTSHNWITALPVSDLVELLKEHLPTETFNLIAAHTNGDLGQFVIKALRLIYGPYDFSLVKR